MVFVNESISIEGNSFFRIMDRDYPGSFFIYNTRNMRNWIASRINHSYRGQRLLDRYRSILQTEDDEKVANYWTEQRTRLEQELNEHFKGTGRLLILDIEKDDCPSQINQFLGMNLDISQWQWVGKTGRRVPHSDHSSFRIRNLPGAYRVRKTVRSFRERFLRFAT